MKNIHKDGIGSLRECARRTGEVGGAFPSCFSARDGCMRRSLTPRGIPCYASSIPRHCDRMMMNRKRLT